MSWIALLGAGALLRALGWNVGHRLGAMLLGVSGLAFIALAFVLMEERTGGCVASGSCLGSSPRERGRRPPLPRRSGDLRASASAAGRSRRAGDVRPAERVTERARAVRPYASRPSGRDRRDRAARDRLQPPLRRRAGGRRRPKANS